VRKNGKNTKPKKRPLKYLVLAEERANRRKLIRDAMKKAKKAIRREQ
jgi:hypothetical protein